MMDDDDGRVKELQNLAWGLQTFTNKPGSHLSAEQKKAAYKVASEALALCSNAVYTEEAHFVERAAVFARSIEAKRAELEEADQAEKQLTASRCFKATSGGNYAVGEKSERREAQASSAALATSGGSDDAELRAKVRELCVPGAESLCFAGLGISDADLDSLLEGLRNAGSESTALDLSRNKLADAGIQRLVAAVAAGACPRLRRLRLGGNDFGALGREMLLGGLRALRRGLELDLGDGKDEESREEQVAAAAAAAPSVRPGAVEVTTAPGEGGCALLRASVPLPEGCSAQDVDLDVSESALRVRTRDGGLLAEAVLPCPADVGSAHATFSRKKQALVITLQARA